MMRNFIIFDIEWLIDQAEETERAYEILADVRNVLLPLVNPKDNECGDMVACTVTEPKCIICLADQIVKQYKDKQDEVSYLVKVGDIKINRLLKALEFYAEGKHYISEGYPNMRFETVDFGDEARKALEGSE